MPTVSQADRAAFAGVKVVRLVLDLQCGEGTGVSGIGAREALTELLRRAGIEVARAAEADAQVIVTAAVGEQPQESAGVQLEASAEALVVMPQLAPLRASWREEERGDGVDARGAAGEASALAVRASASSLACLLVALRPESAAGLLGASDEAAREAAFRAAEEWGEPAVRLLCGALGSAEPAIRSRAARALGRIGNGGAAVVQGLTAALRDQQASVRFAAVSALGELTPPAAAAVPEIVAILGDKEPLLRRAAAEALAGIGPAAEAAAPALVAALRDPEADVRMHAAQALGRIGGPGQAAARALAGVLANREEDVSVQMFAAEALGLIGPAGVPALRSGLRHGQPVVREMSARALGGMGAEAEPAVSALIQALSDEDEWVAKAAVEALGKLGGVAAAAEPYLLSLSQGNDEELRQAAAAALSAIQAGGAPGGSQEVAIALPAASAAAPAVRAAESGLADAVAIEAPEGDLGREAGESSPVAIAAAPAPSARPAVRAAEPEVPGPVAVQSTEAAETGGQPVEYVWAEPGLAGGQAQQPRLGGSAAVGQAEVADVVEPAEAGSRGPAGVATAGPRPTDPGTAAAVASILDGLRRGVRPAARQAEGALAQLGEPAIGPLCAALGDGNATVRSAAAGALAKIGAPAAPAVMDALTGSPDPQVRCGAAAVLGELDAPEAARVEALVRAMGDGEQRVRFAALQALEGMGAAAAPAVPALSAALTGRSEAPPIRRKAAQVLASIGPGAAGAVPALMQALRDDDLWVRRFAASALGSIGPAARLAIPRLRDLAESGDPAQIEAAMALRAIGRPAG